MAKISRFGGPSDKFAQPGDVITNAEDRISALHPDEQGALPLYGEGDDSQWLEDGTDSSASTKKPLSTDESGGTVDRQPVRTTENRSAQDSEGFSTARTTAGGTKASRTK